MVVSWDGGDFFCRSVQIENGFNFPDNHKAAVDHDDPCMSTAYLPPIGCSMC